MPFIPHLAGPVTLRVVGFSGLAHVDVEFEGTNHRVLFPTLLVPVGLRRVGARFTLVHRVDDAVDGLEFDLTVDPADTPEVIALS